MVKGKWYNEKGTDNKFRFLKRSEENGLLIFDKSNTELKGKFIYGYPLMERDLEPLK